MTLIGYTMLCEQAGPKQLVRDVTLAEEAGFDFAVISDRYFPWLDSQGHSRTRGACSALPPSDRPDSAADLCHLPDPPLHPAVVAQKAAR